MPLKPLVRISVFVASMTLAVLVAAPADAGIEANPWQSAGSMTVARSSAMISPLQNGHILVAGGVNGSTVLSSAEIYTPTPTGAGTWAATGALHAARQSAAAVSLWDGRVLVVGGKGAQGTILASAEVFDPVAGTWATTGSMSKARNGMTATLLYTGQVLIAGGTDVGKPVDPLTSAELFDPNTGTFSATGSMTTRRAFATARLLSNGKVLVAGGVAAPDGTLTRSAELFDPATGTWSSAGTMASGRDHLMSALLFDGRVLAIGGQGSSGKPLATAELYSPSSNTWSSGGTFSGGRTAAAADVLYSGKVLIAGGFGGNGNTVLSSADLYTPNGGAGTWGTTNALPAPRGRPMDVRLNDGKTLLTGGWANDGSTVSLKTAVQYAPSPNATFNLTPGFAPAGATVKATGGGFTPGEQVKITFGSTLLATVTANANGGFTVNVTIPADATLGGHLTKAAGQMTGRVAQRWFAVLAA